MGALNGVREGKNKREKKQNLIHKSNASRKSVTGDAGDTGGKRLSDGRATDQLGPPDWRNQCQKRDSAPDGISAGDSQRS